MGEIANDIINGDCCALCGCYFIEGGDGHPVACSDCYDKDCGYIKTERETY